MTAPIALLALCRNAFPSLRSLRPLRSILIGVLAALALAGCAKKAPPKATLTKVVYTVRGEVAKLPKAGDPAAEFMVHHEEIPDFRASLPKGPLGMKPMTMPFTVGPGVSLDGLSLGDKIELKFEVDYAMDTGQLKDSRVVAVAKLPAETPLNFDPSPPAPKPAQ